MALQYTVRNVAGGLGRDNVVIRTHDRGRALSWLAPGYTVTPRDRGRDYYGLRALERRARSIVQYALPGIGRDIYHSREG